MVTAWDNRDLSMDSVVLLLVLDDDDEEDEGGA